MSTDLVARCEKRGYWTAPEGALYLSQVMGLERDQSVVNNSWRSRFGEKPPLTAFVVEDFKPHLLVGITPASMDAWVEQYEPRPSRSAKETPKLPGACLTAAEAADHLHITRKEAYHLVYISQELPSIIYHHVLMTRDWQYPLRCVRADDLEAYRTNHR